MNNLIFFPLLLWLGVTTAYWGPDLPQGPFCGKQGQCCRARQDGCSHEILNTMCYCDEFCKDGRQYDDCCPDYEPVCLDIPLPTTTSAPQTIIEPCMYDNRIYLPNDTRQQDCKKCTCKIDPYTNTTNWECSKDECLVSDNVASIINGQHAGWRAYAYPEFRNRTLKDGVIYKLGTLPLDRLTRNTNAITPSNLDKMVDRAFFDARQEWPKYITPVRDQGWCGSDWAVSLAAIASDRFAILSKGAENLELSPQLFLSCLNRFTRGCGGGHFDGAWNFARNFGMIDEKCFPYQAQKTKCTFSKFNTLIQDGCTPSVKERTDRYRVGPLMRIKGDERAIMADILLSGPLQAIMTVYQDFFHYRDGIYRHLRAGDQRISGLHSVRIVGWGEERGEKYWIVANTWGVNWGENGYFRILRGINESGIEDFIASALPEVTEAYVRK